MSRIAGFLVGPEAVLIGAITSGLIALPLGASEAQFEAELIFPPQHWHNHASCVVQLPNSDLLVCWYRGSGERKADDVVLLGARRAPEGGQWSEPFVMADSPGYPDANPAMVVDPQQRLWLVWPTILDNQWESALLKYRVSTNHAQPGPPIWSVSEVLHVTPGEKFAEGVARHVASLEPELTGVGAEELRGYWHGLRDAANVKLTRRLGWMPRVHPIIVGGRLLIPLYSDGFNFSLMVYTDDWGATWQTSHPLPGPGGVQPSIVQRRDGSLYTLMRDNGPAPKRLQQSQSHDRGETWSPVSDAAIPNPGSGLEIITLRSGEWVLINNDTERGRHRLVVEISDDEGRSWKWRRYLENDPPGPEAGSFSYPSLIEGADGFLHATYSYHLNRADLPRDADGLPARKSIKHARFNLEWVRAGSAEPSL